MDQDEVKWDTYSEIFVRAQRRISRDALREYAEDIRPSGAQSGDHKLENLYVDCFSHHVIEFCEFGNTITLLSPPDPKRIVAADNISSVTSGFSASFYKSCIPEFRATMLLRERPILSYSRCHRSLRRAPTRT